MTAKNPHMHSLFVAHFRWKWAVAGRFPSLKMSHLEASKESVPHGYGVHHISIYIYIYGSFEAGYEGFLNHPLPSFVPSYTTFTKCSFDSKKLQSHSAPCWVTTCYKLDGSFVYEAFLSHRGTPSHHPF